MRAITVSATLALGVLIAACAARTPREPPAPSIDFSTVTARVQASVDHKEIPSAAYALVRDGAIVHQGAAGYADVEDRVLATPRTPYPLASVTKPIAATALMLLAEQGVVDLDRPALPYAGLAHSDTPYSLRQLLSHTAGLGTYARIDWKDRPLAQRPLLDSVKAYGFSAQPPGTVFEYSNLGYGLIGMIIEQQSGVPLGQFLEDKLFAPLGMDDAQLANGFNVPANAALKYGADGARLPDSANDTPAAGNVYASARDLARFAAFSLGQEAAGTKPILGPRARQQMQTAAAPQALHPYYGGAGYGLGWYVHEIGGESVVWHEGGMPGASSLIVLLPKRRLAAVVVINANDVNTKAQEIATALLRAAAPDAPKISLVATDGLRRYAGEPALLGRWSGHIEIDGKRLPWALEFAKDGTLRAELPDAAGKTSAPQTAYAALLSGPLLLATLPGRLPARDVDPARDGFVLLRLIHRGDRLDGMAIAYASEQRLEHLYPFAAGLARGP